MSINPCISDGSLRSSALAFEKSERYGGVQNTIVLCEPVLSVPESEWLLQKIDDKEPASADQMLDSPAAALMMAALGTAEVGSCKSRPCSSTLYPDSLISTSAASRHE